MKIQKKLSTVSQFSGISLVNNGFDKSGLSQLIDNYICTITPTKGYTYNNGLKKSTQCVLLRR
jgi:hypothetical protein